MQSLRLTAGNQGLKNIFTASPLAPGEKLGDACCFQEYFVTFAVLFLKKLCTLL
jgi:hypothetical protein